MKIEFRQADAGDHDTLLQLMREYYAFDGIAFDEAKARRGLGMLLSDARYGLAWLIEAEGVLAGYVVLALGFALEYGGCDAFLDELFLRESFRSRGIGTRALEFVENEARRLDVRALHLVVEHDNEKAHAVYRRFGFEDQERFLMTKPL